MTSTPSAATPTSLGRLVARSIEVADPGPLLDLLPEDAPTAWLRRGEGIVGWGVAASVRTSGPERFDAAVDWWHQVSASAVVRDELAVPGSGLICLGSFAFADDPGDSVLIVPKVVVGRRGDRTWVTVIGDDEVSPPPDLVAQPEPRAPGEVVFADGSVGGTAWEAVVAQAVQRINAGELEKVVLARDLIASTEAPLDVRWPLRRLGSEYEMCWTFHVDGLFGATPELLVRRERGLVTSRVLAGTIRRTGDDERDLALAATLARSSKDLEEHEYAVRSVADSLAPHCTSMNVPESPFVLHLPNVMHLATDVAGVVPDTDSSTVLELAAALHPSAAVGGTPTDVAVAMISEIEGMDRGRYAGPVGWMDASGDGEFGIALRSAEYGPGPNGTGRVRLFAGCGIVAESDPESELAEAQAKFVPVRDALAGR
ncbi:isochorismate synthase [Nocardioides marmoriginsengisoli]|uniref:isochorismate synthase n=1 Tax=Nocardioides marmoriginsengisoli TaxID=661483 RepID=A0A3N0CFS0_9ACTN|nr:isochorismate synthase [Nocardioides marmoriginsengisoli]RNL62295.1 isochorismate synthase [Nocardioides marmoriginsengisoli]